MITSSTLSLFVRMEEYIYILPLSANRPTLSSNEDLWERVLKFIIMILPGRMCHNSLLFLSGERLGTQERFRTSTFGAVSPEKIRRSTLYCRKTHVLYPTLSSALKRVRLHALQTALREEKQEAIHVLKGPFVGPRQPDPTWRYSALSYATSASQYRAGYTRKDIPRDLIF